MDTLTGTLKVNIATTVGKTADFGNATQSVNSTKTITLSFGTVANQANQMFADSRTLAGSASESLDLSGSLTNAFGETIALTRIVALYIENTSTTDSIEVGGAASNAVASIFGATADTIKIRPGGFLLLGGADVTGYAVVAATADLLKVANLGAGSTTYKIIIFGS